MRKICKILCLALSLILVFSCSYAAPYTIDEGSDFFDKGILPIAIGMELFCSIHMSVFVLMPLSKVISKKNSNTTFIILFIIRVVILIIGDIIMPIAMAMIDFISIFIGAFVVMPVLGGASMMHKNKYVELDDFPDVSDYEIANLKISNLEEFKNQLIEKVKESEQAFCDFDYDKLKKMYTVQEYIEVSKHLKAIEKKKQKAVIADFDVKESKIYSVNRGTDNIVVSFVFKAEVQDFICDQSGKIHSGSAKKVDKIYIVEFRKNISEEEVKYSCNNCGATLEDINATVCKYCASLIERKNRDWVISELNKIDAKK